MKTLVLKVMLWGREMGRLMWDSDRKTSYFMYNPEVIGGELDMAPLVASVASKPPSINIWRTGLLNISESLLRELVEKYIRS